MLNSIKTRLLVTVFAAVALTACGKGTDNTAGGIGGGGFGGGSCLGNGQNMFGYQAVPDAQHGQPRWSTFSAQAGYIANVGGSMYQGQRFGRVTIGGGNQQQAQYRGGGSEFSMTLTIQPGQSQLGDTFIGTVTIISTQALCYIRFGNATCTPQFGQQFQQGCVRSIGFDTSLQRSSTTGQGTTFDTHMYIYASTTNLYLYN